MYKQIKIDGVSQDKVQFGTKITLLSGKEKYSFFDKKKDGSNTKAYEQFIKYGFKVGDLVFAEVKEEEKKFVNDKGQDVSYVQRTILYFQVVDDLPVVETPKIESLQTLADAIRRLEARVEVLEQGERVVETEEVIPF